VPPVDLAHPAAVRRIVLSQATLDDLRSVADLDDRGLCDPPWEAWAGDTLTPDEDAAVRDVVRRLRRTDATLINEATVWARVIYPLLVLAERDGVQTWSQVALSATIADAELIGVVDGAFGRPVAGVLEAPWLLVVEARRGVDATSPRVQLYGELLASAALNHRRHPQAAHTVDGCTTVADTFTFVRAEVSALDTPRPSLRVWSSREYTAKSEAPAILAVLKRIVAESIARLPA
jgi:hypothetical protein